VLTHACPAPLPPTAIGQVIGESCIPGIAADNTDAIFEEHTVSACLDAACAVRNEYGTRERVFNFGAVVADLMAQVEADGKLPPCAGVRANLKFINPIKVPCTVNFSIRARGAPTPGVTFPMAVDPPQLIIPPNEYRYTSIVFAPNAIQQYSGQLEAVVVDGSHPATKSFACEVRGEGTLPSLSLQVRLGCRVE
jgi:hydrocephalus-inducing protein